MGTLPKFEALLFSEQPLDEPVQLLSRDEGYMGEAFPGLRDLDVNQSKRRVSFLMPREPGRTPANLRPRTLLPHRIYGRFR